MKFKFSVIIPIYNVEKYLEETILSVVNQTIGFEKNIQMILVNDGSPDNSKEICQKYKKLYPNNVIYIEQENAGVSAARNKGLEYATGEYINFLDSDDIWDKNVFKVALKMFESNPGLPLIGVRQKCFEASTAYTSLDYKYQMGNRIVSMENEFSAIHLSVSGGFMAREYINDIRFDTRVKYSEDAKFIYEVLITNKKKEYGLIASNLYYYRKRFSQNSAIQTKDTKPDWYFITTELSYNYLLELAKQKFPELLNCVAYYVAYDYQWRIRTELEKVLTPEDKNKYLQVSKDLFSKIPPEVILAQKQIDYVDKIVMLNFKYDNDYKKITKIINNNKSITMFIDLFEYQNGILKIEGYPMMPETNVTECFVKLDNKLKKLKLNSREYPLRKNCLGINSGIVGFSLEIKVQDVSTIEFYMKTEDGNSKMNIYFGRLAKLANLPKAYYECGKNTVSKSNETVIIKHNQNVLIHCLNEIKFLLKIKNKKVIILRMLFHILPKTKKQIWIFSDRQEVAGDNAEALFKYVNEQKNKNIRSYFVIKKGSKDVKRLKKYGNVIYYNTLKYAMLFLKSHCIISSHSERYTTNCFGKKQEYYKDLYKFKYIFLQHGIIRNDLSDWLNKYNKNIHMFITSTKGEYDSITQDCNYYYDKKVVKLTGLPRYDNLYNNNLEVKKQIIILPTWRAYLAGARVTGQKRLYNDKFKESYFYKTYNSLLNDKRIIEVLKEYGYKMKFCLHPSLSEQANDFDGNEYVEICRENIDYQYEFKANKIMITDYSSVSCDFAYLRKPVIYLKGDKQEFFANHIYSEGYFNEEKDGFGPVAYDYEQAVDIIIKAIKKDGKMEEKYIKNVNKFFKFHDGNNCKRVYQEILKLN